MFAGIGSSVSTDAEPPAVGVSVTPSVLWPPNRKMVAVTPTVSAKDVLNPKPRVEFVGVKVSEPADGQGSRRGQVHRQQSGQAQQAGEQRARGQFARQHQRGGRVQVGPAMALLRLGATPMPRAPTPGDDLEITPRVSTNTGRMMQEAWAGSGSAPQRLGLNVPAPVRYSNLMKRRSWILSGVLALVGSVYAVPGYTFDFSSTVYVCQNNQRLTITAVTAWPPPGPAPIDISLAPQFVLVDYQGRQYALAQAGSASGARYASLLAVNRADLGLEWWEHQGEGTLSRLTGNGARPRAPLLKHCRRV